jgi:hypothetical protein
VAERSKAGAGDQANVSASEDSDIHSNPLLKRALYKEIGKIAARLWLLPVL